MARSKKCSLTCPSARIIDDLAELCHVEDTAALAYFFFDFSTPAKQSHEDALRSIVMQLARQSSMAWQILTEATEYFEGIHQMYETAWNVSASFLLKILDRYLLAYSRVYFVLDALDESTGQEDVLGFVQDLIERRSCRISILITSRQQRNIQQTLENVASEVVPVEAETIDQDIRLHIQKRLNSNQRFQRWPASLRQEIEVSLIKGALGM